MWTVFLTTWRKYQCLSWLISHGKFVWIISRQDLRDRCYYCYERIQLCLMCLLCHLWYTTLSWDSFSCLCKFLKSFVSLIVSFSSWYHLKRENSACSMTLNAYDSLESLCKALARSFSWVQWYHVQRVLLWTHDRRIRTSITSTDCNWVQFSLSAIFWRKWSASSPYSHYHICKVS